MRALLTLTLKDLRRRLAQPSAFLLTLAIPLAISGTMALAFGTRAGNEDRTPVLRLLVVDLDGTPVSGFLTGATQNPEVAKRMEIKQAKDRDEGLRLLHDEGFAALLVIPKGFSDDVLSGRQSDLEVVKNPAQSVMPVVAQQGAEVLALYISTGKRLLGSDTETARKLLDGKGWDDSLAIAGLITSTYARVQAADDLLFPPLIEVTTARKETKARPFNFMVWMYPGMMVMGILYVSLMQMKDLLDEREGGTLRRQLCAPLGAGKVLLAKILAVAAVVAIAQVFLLAAGAFAFQIDWGPWIPLATTSLLIVFAATGFAAMLFSLVRTERQGDAFGGILVMLMSLLGGSFVPPQVLPEWLQRLSVLTLSHWGHEALRSLLAGGSWDAIGAYLGALAAIGLVFTSLGMALLGRRHMRGAL